MSNSFDFAIIGAGPAGLSLAWYLAKINKKIVIIDSENDIGGNHRVKRINGMFSEHGPRIYLNNFYNFKNLLKSMDLNFNDLFTFSNYILSQNSFKFNTKEYFWISVYLILFLIGVGIENTKHTTLLEFTDKYKFSLDSKNQISTFCRKTDGADIDRYTLYAFLQLINQNSFYAIYQPKKPNDIGLFSLWKKKLLETGNVSLILNSKVVNFTGKSIVIQGGQNIIADKFVFTIAPMKLIELGGLKLNENYINWANKSSYHNYIPMTFHWNKKIEFPPKTQQLPSTEWGIFWNILSDFTDFQDNRSQTVITCSISLTDTISSFINKTANNSTIDEIYVETFRQINEYYNGKLILPDYSLVSPNINRVNDKWIDNDTSVVFTTTGYSPAKKLNENVYLLSPQNGNSPYVITSIDMAISNSMALFNELIKENLIKSHKIKIVNTVLTIRNIIVIILLLFIIVIIICKKIYLN